MVLCLGAGDVRVEIGDEGFMDDAVELLFRSCFTESRERRLNFGRVLVVGRSHVDEMDWIMPSKDGQQFIIKLLVGGFQPLRFLLCLLELVHVCANLSTISRRKPAQVFTIHRCPSS
jgi:hypothetical protein